MKIEKARKNENVKDTKRERVKKTLIMDKHKQELNEKERERERERESIRLLNFM